MVVSSNGQYPPATNTNTAATASIIHNCDDDDDKDVSTL